MPLPIFLLSGPRNVSTALMYSFAQRSDVLIIDEPLYGHYLRVSASQHPGREAVMAAQDCDGQRVIRKLLAQQEQSNNRRLFVKHMAHHLIDVDLDFLTRTDNVFLIRDPREMLPSLTIQLPQAKLDDTGLRRQWNLFAELKALDLKPAIVDSRQLLMNPEIVLKKLCQHLGLKFEPNMLRWKAGARPEDGVWAPHWYHAVHKTTGFATYQPKNGFPKALLPLLNECRPWYDKLFAHAIRAEY